MSGEVGPCHPLSISGEADPARSGEKIVGRDKLVGLRIEFLRLGAAVEPKKEDAVAGSVSYRSLETQRTICDLDWVRSTRPIQAPEIGIAAV